MAVIGGNNDSTKREISWCTAVRAPRLQLSHLRHRAGAYQEHPRPLLLCARHGHRRTVAARKRIYLGGSVKSDNVSWRFRETLWKLEGVARAACERATLSKRRPM